MDASQSTPLLPANKRKYHKRKRGSPGAPPVAPLTLVAAEYDESNWVRMTFDRAIDVSAMLPDSITVRDGPFSGDAFSGSGTPLLISPTTVQVELTAFETTGGAEVLLTADAANGIVASDDGAAWDGVSGVTLPFP